MDINTPKKTVIVNFKKLAGNDAVDLAIKLNEADDALLDTYDIVLAVQAPDIVKVSQCCKFSIFVQDIFSDEKNSFLQYFEKIRFSGCYNVTGVILNHPEKKLSPDVLEASIRKAMEMELKLLICATSIREAVRLDKYAPSFIGIENEDLIGKEDSFVNHCPQIVREAKSHIGADILIGAGVKTSHDLNHVIETGGSGVLISSLILKSTDPSSTLNDFLNLKHHGKYLVI
jgi:triosephosphate isomerase